MVSHYDRRSAKNGHRLHNGHDDGDTRSRSRSDSRGSSRSRGRSRRWRVAPTPAPTSVPAPSPAPCPSSCTAPSPFQRAPPRKLRQVLAACHLRCHAASPVSGSAQAGGARDRRRFCRPGQIECRPPRHGSNCRQRPRRSRRERLGRAKPKRATDGCRRCPRRRCRYCYRTCSDVRAAIRVPRHACRDTRAPICVL